MGDEDQDPEVVADMRLRAATEASRPAAPMPSWKPPEVAAQWKCRHPRCSRLVDVPPDAVEYRDMFNRMLTARGEAPMSTDAIVVCDEHRRELADFKVEYLRRQNERLKLNIQRLKASRDPERETELIAEIRRDHHPFVDELVQSLAEKVRNGTSRKRGL